MCHGSPPRGFICIVLENIFLFLGSHAQTNFKAGLDSRRVNGGFAEKGPTRACFFSSFCVFSTTTQQFNENHRELHSAAIPLPFFCHHAHIESTTLFIPRLKEMSDKVNSDQGHPRLTLEKQGLKGSIKMHSLRQHGRVWINWIVHDPFLSFGSCSSFMQKHIRLSLRNSRPGRGRSLVAQPPLQFFFKKKRVPCLRTGGEGV